MKNTVINFKITTLSPVCILDEDGKKLSPYIDIIKDKDSIIELDKEKIINSIINDNRSFNSKKVKFLTFFLQHSN